MYMDIQLDIHVIMIVIIFQVYEHVDEAGNCVRCERI